jgi:hypothetical protein
VHLYGLRRKKGRIVMHFIKRVLGKVLFSRRTFDCFQRFGIHVTNKHFYSPIPNTKELKEKSGFWKKEKELVGIDLSIAKQLDLLQNVFPKFQKECNFPLNKTSVPYEYYLNNGAFGLVSAAVLHCMIRYFRPQTIIEVGSGSSTYVSARACLMNKNVDGKNTNLISIEPYPNKVLSMAFPGLTELIPKKVEEVDIKLFEQLEDGDILFLDSSHNVRIGGDVNYLYLEVIPRLKKGVIIHIHDIFFPEEYPEEWVISLRRFWTEQYLLQAFLAFNDHFKVLWCGSYIYLKYFEKLKSAFPPPADLGFCTNYFSSSFWMRKIV